MRILAQIALVFVVLVALGVSVPASAAMKIFMNIPEAPGESTDDHHQNWIDVLSFSHGVSRPVCLADLEHSEFVFTKYTDSASENLYDIAAQRTVIPQIDVEIVHVGETDAAFYTYEFQSVIVISGAVSAIQNDARPLETWSFSYGQMRLRYRVFDPPDPPDPWQEVLIFIGPCNGH